MTSYQLQFVELGFSEDAAKALIEAGLDSFVDIASLTEDDVSSLLRSLRKPGGGAKGFEISFLSEKRLKTIVFGFRRQLYRTDVYSETDVTKANADMWQYTSLALKNYKDPEDEFEVKDYGDNWPKIFEKLDAHLGQFRSELTMVPLTYVVRDCNLPAATTKSYKSDEEKEVARCPHFLMPNRQGATSKDMDSKDRIQAHWFVADNKRVWEILYKIFNNTPSYEYMKVASKGKDGRRAYQALKEHYLGANNTNLLAAKYEKEIGDLSYTGDKRRWSLEKYINKHVEYYNILNGLKAHGYAGIDTASRVRKLLNGIKCKDLESPISIILAKPDTTFDEATRILKDFLSAYSSARSSKITQIGAVGGNQSGGGRRSNNNSSKGGKDGRGDGNTNHGNSGGIEDRYYSPAEYKTLSKEQKDQLRKLRLKRKGTDVNSTLQPTKRVQYNKDDPLFARAVAAVVADMHNAGSSDGGGGQANDGTLVSVDGTNSTGGNRGHPALRKRS